MSALTQRGQVARAVSDCDGLGSDTEGELLRSRCTHPSEVAT